MLMFTRYVIRSVARCHIIVVDLGFILGTPVSLSFFSPSAGESEKERMTEGKRKRGGLDPHVASIKKITEQLRGTNQ